MKKRIIYIILAILGILIILLLLNFFAKQKIEVFLEENKVRFNDVSLNLYTNRLKVKQPVFSNEKFKVSAENFEVTDFNYYDYLFKSKMVFEDVRLIRPIIELFEKKEGQGENNGKSTSFKKDIFIENFQAMEGKVEKKTKDSVQPSLFFAFSEFRIKDISADSASVEKTLPFQYGEYVLFGDKFQMKLNEEHDFSIGKIRMRDGRVSLENLNISARYGKEEFQQIIPHEKDHYTVSIKEVTMDSLQFDSHNDSLKLSNPQLSLNGLDMEVYRDKTNREDPRIKTLYNEKLRNLPFKIAFKNVEVNNSRVVYQEKTKEGNPPGEISFNSVKISIENLNNIKGSGETKMNANSIFMGASSFNFNYSFNAWNMNNTFSASGRLNEMQISEANRFLNPAANIKLEGEIDFLAFNISGNEDNATGDVAFQYHDLKIELQEKNSAGEKEIVSALANLFINNKALNGEVKQNGIDVKRDKNRSFWNYIWKVVLKGIKDAVL